MRKLLVILTAWLLLATATVAVRRADRSQPTSSNRVRSRPGRQP